MSTSTPDEFTYLITPPALKGLKDAGKSLTGNMPCMLAARAFRTARATPCSLTYSPRQPKGMMR